MMEAEAQSILRQYRRASSGFLSKLGSLFVCSLLLPVMFAIEEVPSAVVAIIGLVWLGLFLKIGQDVLHLIETAYEQHNRALFGVGRLENPYRRLPDLSYEAIELQQLDRMAEVMEEARCKVNDILREQKRVPGK